MLELLGLLAFGDAGWGDELLAGAGLTLALAVCTLPIGLTLGLVVALAKDSRSWIARLLGNAFTTLFRSLPALLTILIIYFGGQILLRSVLQSLGVETQFEINGFVAGLIALGVVLGAFSSEVWLGALRGVPKGQREAAFALGLTRSQAFVNVVFPQLLRLALPGLGNNWMALLKDTSLVSVIAFSDLLRMTSIAVGVTKEPLFFYFVCCLLYLAMAIASSFVIDRIEQRANRGFQRARS